MEWRRGRAPDAPGECVPRERLALVPGPAAAARPVVQTSDLSQVTEMQHYRRDVRIGRLLPRTATVSQREPPHLSLANASRPHDDARLSTRVTPVLARQPNSLGTGP
jgi:hypothetical protein